MNRRRNSYTTCRCGQAGSRVGSSSSASAPSPSDGGRARNRLCDSMCTMSELTASVNFPDPVLT